METLLQGIPHVSIYLDDILITGTSEDDHLKTLDRAAHASLVSVQSANFSLSNFVLLWQLLTVVKF